MQTILLIEDEQAIADTVLYALKSEGFNSRWFSLGGEGVAWLQQHPDTALLILDVGLPDGNGFEFCKSIRRFSEIPIIFLTARNEEVDRIVGLEIGADDYVSKPFDPRELRARLKNVARRYQRPVSTESSSSAAAQNDKSIVKFGPCTLNLVSYQLLDKDGQEIPITNMEFDLLKVFAERPNRPLNRDQLLNLTQNRDWDPYDRSIDIRITRLRKKIEPDPEKPQVIKTVRGIGYMFVGSEK